MRKFTLLVAVVLLAAMPALAQEYPKGEFYAGYAFARSESIDVNVPAGFAVNFAGNFTKNLGIVGDFGAHFKDVTVLIGTTPTSVSTKTYTYLGGVRVASRGERATGFAHAMAGGLTADAGAAGSENGFALGFGGGVDAYATDRVGFRGEFLWIPARLAGEWFTENFRVGGGIVIKIGQ